MQMQALGALMMRVAMVLRLAGCAPRRRALVLLLCVCLLAPAPPARSLPLSQSTGLTLFVLSGTAAVLRQDGTAVSPAPNGMELAPGDQVATLARSEVRINVDDGSWVQLGAETTLTLNEKDRRPDGSLLLTATQSRGVTSARTPDHDVEIRLISGPDDVVALLRRGGMALGSDEGTGDVTTACETQQSELFFPYENLRVPCEQNTVRTRTARGDIFDSSSKDAPLSYVSAVVSPNIPGQLPGTSSPGLVNDLPQNPPSSSSDSPVVVATSCPTEVPRSNVISIDLSWSQSHDLDAHLSGPRFTGADSSQRFHVFSPFIGGTPKPDSVSHAALECDSVTGASIERMVIVPVSGAYVAGEYHFWVHNFSGQNSGDARFGAYPASVSVFRNGVRTHGPFSVADVRDTAPIGTQKSLWYVFQIAVTADGSVNVAPIQELRVATTNFSTVLGVKDGSTDRRSSGEDKPNRVRKRGGAR